MIWRKSLLNRLILLWLILRCAMVTTHTGFSQRSLEPSRTLTLIDPEFVEEDTCDI